MKVISGKLKGRNILGYNINGTRPTMERVKESIMGSIQDYIEDSVVLDLFAGSGNLGIEAISNGASKCYFVDSNRECIGIIKKNIHTFEIDKQCVVVQNDYLLALKKFYNQRISFDIIFVDPPYQYKILNEILDLIKEYEILNNGGIIVLEYQEMDFKKVDSHYQMLKSKKYGDKYVAIYRLKK